MKEVIIQQINTTSELYPLTLELRDLVLRQPLGMSIHNEQLIGEDEAVHLCALYEGRIVGVLLLKKVDDDTVQMKQVAVDESLRGKSIGRRLVEHAEQVAHELGYIHIVLHARQVALPFYEKLNYTVFDEPFIEVGIPHRNMIKTLAAADYRQGEKEA
ncbi:GNAT family N-acetyltransferase [Paenibacillus sp. WLX1005]|uniref:GNAT family N-acetyltransferase n=1 Tax=Paenibacillus sp. WLX1005 TaxID=3243766 RepID=UPI003983F675